MKRLINWLLLVAIVGGLVAFLVKNLNLIQNSKVADRKANLASAPAVMNPPAEASGGKSVDTKISSDQGIQGLQAVPLSDSNSVNAKQVVSGGTITIQSFEDIPEDMKKSMTPKQLKEVKAIFAKIEVIKKHTKEQEEVKRKFINEQIRIYKQQHNIPN